LKQKRHLALAQLDVGFDLYEDKIKRDLEARRRVQDLLANVGSVLSKKAFNVDGLSDNTKR
jgi:hypothetical protein